MVVFDPAKLQSTDPREAAAHQYQAILDYAANRLTGPEYANLQAEMNSAGLPLLSDSIASVPDPVKLVDLLQLLAMRFVSTQPINPATIATLPPTFSGNLAIAGGLTVSGLASIGGNLNVLGGLTAQALTAQLGAGSVGGAIQGGAGHFLGGLHVGSQVAVAFVNNENALTIENYLQTAGLVLTAPVADPYLTSVPNGSFGEDASGDLFIKGVNAVAPGQGVLTYINRPTCDTGWLELNHASVGRVGALGNPLVLPDIYDDQVPALFGGPLGRTAFISDPGVPSGSSDPQGPGAPLGVIYHAIWLEVQDPTLVGLPGGSGTVYIPLGPSFDAAGNFAGATIHAQVSTGNVYLIIGTNLLVPGYPAVDPNSGALVPGTLRIRLLLFRRHSRTY